MAKNIGGAKAFSLRLHPETYERVKFWADRNGSVSMNEWIVESIEQRIARANGDYDLPTAEIARLNQLIDAYNALADTVANLEKVVLAMSESITGLARGDSYLLDAEDGELRS